MTHLLQSKGQSIHSLLLFWSVKRVDTELQTSQLDASVHFKQLFEQSTQSKELGS